MALWWAIATESVKRCAGNWGKLRHPRLIMVDREQPPRCAAVQQQRRVVHCRAVALTMGSSPPRQQRISAAAEAWADQEPVAAALAASVELAYRVVAELEQEVLVALRVAAVAAAQVEVRRRSAMRPSRRFSLRPCPGRRPTICKCPRHRCKGHIPDQCHQYHRSRS